MFQCYYFLEWLVWSLKFGFLLYFLEWHVWSLKFGFPLHFLEWHVWILKFGFLSLSFCIRIMITLTLWKSTFCLHELFIVFLFGICVGTIVGYVTTGVFECVDSIPRPPAVGERLSVSPRSDNLLLCLLWFLQLVLLNDLLPPSAHYFENSCHLLPVNLHHFDVFSYLSICFSLYIMTSG